MFSPKQMSSQKKFMVKIKDNFVIGDVEKIYLKFYCGYYLTLGTIVGYYHY